MTFFIKLVNFVLNFNICFALSNILNFYHNHHHNHLANRPHAFDKKFDDYVVDGRPLGKKKIIFTSRFSVSSGVGRTGCWHEYKSLRKHYINFISKPIDKLDHRCAGKMFNFNFVCIVELQNS